MKKKLVACLLVMGIALVGCGNNNNTAAAPTEAAPAATETQTETPAATETQTETPAAEETEVQATESAVDYSTFAGGYQDSWSQRAFCEVTEAEDGKSVNVLIQWGSSAVETNMWQMNCTYDETDGVSKLVYSNGAKYEVTYDEDGSEFSNTVYSDGQGYFVYDSATGNLAWSGAVDEECRECVFEKLPE